MPVAGIILGMVDDVQRIDTYCDTVPRASATTEYIGPFTLFVGRSGRSLTTVTENTGVGVGFVNSGTSCIAVSTEPDG